MIRRIFTLAFVLLSAAAQAQEPYPSRPVRLIVPYPPGGSSDNVSRVVAERLSPLLGQPIIVDNRGGAAGTIGAQAAQAAKPDGYTLMMAPTAVFAITPHLRKVPYDPVNGFDTVALIATAPSIAVVHKDSPIKTMGEFIAAAKKQPGKMSFGSAGLGSITQLYGEILKQRAGIDILHVPFKGSADAMTAVLGKQVDLMIDPVALGQARGGGVRAIAIFGERRIPELPDVPTIAEAGYDIDIPSWFGLFAPKGTPPAIVAKISADAAKALREPETEQKLLKVNLFAAYLDPAAFAKKLKQDDALLAEIIRKAGIKAE
jgi:tripartite-type tricarboxylate transporter receptor subunit TctC